MKCPNYARALRALQYQLVGVTIPAGWSSGKTPLDTLLSARAGTNPGGDVGDACPPPAIFKHAFDEYNFSIILNFFDSNKPYALSTHDRKCTNKMHHIW